MVEIEIIMAQFVALGFMVAVREVYILIKWHKDRMGPTPISVKTPILTTWLRAKHITLIIKNGRKSLPTKKEILSSPMVDRDYPELFA